MKGTARVGAIATIVAGIAGVVWFALEIVPPSLGFEDTDSPAVMLEFLRGHSDVFLQAADVLLLLAICLTIATFAVRDALLPRADSLGLRFVSAMGLFAAAFLFMNGVVRASAGPLVYIDGLDHDWGAAAYLAVQMVGTHGFAQGGTLAFCIWAIGVSLIGLRTRTLPAALCALGVIPAFRLLTLLLGPWGLLPDGLWIVAMIAIPGTMLWCVFLGVVLLRRSFARRPAQEP